MALSRETFLRIAQALARYSYDEECKELAEQVLNELVPISEDNLAVALSSLIVDPLAFRLAMAIALGDQGQTNAPVELADPDDAESFGPFHFDNNPKWIGRKVVIRNGGILTIQHVDDTWSGEADDEPIMLENGKWCHKDGRYYFAGNDNDWDIVRLLAKGA
jgi:hypothetical protein